jgi:GT2 family glycosyltransferase
MPLKFNGDRPIVDIIMPTHENHAVLAQAVKSVMKFTNIPFRLLVVNNSEQPIQIEIVDLFGKQVANLFEQGGYDNPFMDKLEMGQNTGWMGGINAGINYFQGEEGGLSKYVLFLNDDIQIIDQHYSWLANMINVMEYYPEVGAVGPISNAVMFRQHITYGMHRTYHEESVLSGFCFLTRRDVIEKIGILDERLFGGDDVDYSIRIKDAGWKLAVCRRSFVYHWHAVTGRRLHPDWDTREWSEKISREIIRKHGFRKWFETMEPPGEQLWEDMNNIDAESQCIRTIIPDNGKIVLDMGCGNNKIWPSATGVDLLANGQRGIGGMRFTVNKMTDVVADISEPMPMFESDFADYILGKHILEHITDHISTLREWNRILKPGGKLVLAVPNEDLGEAMSVDPTHVHVFDKKSLDTVLSLTGYKMMDAMSVDGGFSIVAVAEKVGGSA